MTEMAMRERMLAVVQGKEHDRVPFVQYSGLAAPDEEVWSVVGREKMGILRWSAVHRVEHPRCRTETESFERRGLKGVRTTIHTSGGSLRQEKLIEPAYGSAHVSEHFVKEKDDYVTLLEFLRDAVVVEDAERLERDIVELGEDGLPHVSLGRTPFQQLWVEWVSIEDLCCHMVDFSDLMADVVAAIADVTRRLFPIAARSRAPYVVFADNITAPIIGVKYFAEYCVPLYDEAAGMLEEKGIPLFVHMDGDLKPLWEAIGESRVLGLDSLSPPPDNDTSVADAARMWPEMRLLVNYPSSVHLAPPERVYETAARMLAEGGHTGRLQIQISENVPQDAWRRSYPEIVRAIEDSGPP